MKRALLAATAILSSSILSTPALAVDVTPDSVTQPDQAMMDAYCDANFVTDDTHYVEAAVMGSVIEGTLEEVGGTREDVEASREGDPNSSISYDGLLGVGGTLVRIGGSPNMFASGSYSDKNYSASFVDQTAVFTHRDEYPFTCKYWTDTVTEEEVGGSTTGNPGSGNCVGDPHKKDAIDGVGPGKGAQNSNPHSACHEGGIVYHHDWSSQDYDFSFYYTPEGVRGPAESSVPSNIPFTETSGPYSPGNWYGAACISPSNTQTGKKGNPGTWRTANNYSGPGTCSTATFLAAQTIYGHEFVDPIPSNSLPQ